MELASSSSHTKALPINNKHFPCTSLTSGSDQAEVTAWLPGPLPSPSSALTAVAGMDLLLKRYRNFKGGKYLVKTKPEIIKRTILLSWEIFSHGYF